MVMIVDPDACTASMEQDFTARPSTCTTQAPHCDVSQPTWVPVRPRCSLRKCTSSVRSSALPLTRFPFTVNDTSDMQPPWVQTLVITLPMARLCLSAMRCSHTVQRAKQRCQRRLPCTFGHGQHAVRPCAGAIAKSGIEGKDTLDAGVPDTHNKRHV